MLDTYIKNRGTTQTFIHNNNYNSVNEMKWDEDYDGETANLSLDIRDNNNNNKHINLKMNNNELSELLNIPIVQQSIDKRLKNDFFSKRTICNPKFIQIYQKPQSYHKQQKKVHFAEPNLELIDNYTPIKTPREKIYTHISSPLPNEELIYPLELKKKMTNRHYNTKPRSHITLKVNRKPKTLSLKNRVPFSKLKPFSLKKKLTRRTL